MISFDVKAEKNSSSQLGLSQENKKDDKGFSFAELLKGVTEQKDTEVVQNGALVLSLGDNEKDISTLKTPTKNDALLALLKNETSKLEESSSVALLDKSAQSFTINPKLTATLTKQDMRNLISDAKKYLKLQILQSDGYKQSEIKELPKTLRGLADLAKKVGIDIGKISLEQVQGKDVTTLKTELTPLFELKTPKSKISTNPEIVTQAKIVDTKKELIPQIGIQAKAISVQAEPISQVGLQTKAEPISQVGLQTKAEKNIENLNEVVVTKTEDKKTALDIPSTSLLKIEFGLKHSTEQFVQSKQLKIEEKTPRERADETLKSLLTGEKPSQIIPVLSGNFSVETAKVITSVTTTESVKTLEQLLHGDMKENSTSKLDGLNIHKADSLEVKVNEAKHMIKYLSIDVKTAIEDYKSPFTRIKIQLNPEQLGDVDLTIVQRGKNLHVNLSSNSTAINTLSMNINELKTQLSNNGINNATFNFSSSSENGASSQQQGQKHQGKQAHEEYSYFDNEIENEEILSSLEIVVPRYI